MLKPIPGIQDDPIPENDKDIRTNKPLVWEWSALRTRPVDSVFPDFSTICKPPYTNHTISIQDHAVDKSVRNGSPEYSILQQPVQYSSVIAQQKDVQHPPINGFRVPGKTL